MLLKCYSQYASKFGKFSTTTGLEKVSFHSTPKERQFQRMLKLLYICAHCASKVTLKILQAWFQQYMNQTVTDVQMGFRKGRGTTDQIRDHREIKGIPKKNLLLLQ